MNPTTGQRTTIVITMAGEGERFRREGYTLPKFMIEVRGRSLFHWAVSSLANFFSKGAQPVFIAQRKHAPEAFITRECLGLDIMNPRIVLLDAPTDGQATTALGARSEIDDPEGPLLIYNIDTCVEREYLNPRDVCGDGWIPCFPGLGEAWSFAEAGPDGLISRVVEKQRISPHATIGLYGFRSFSTFERLYSQHFTNRKASDEKYIAPMYNTLIAGGGRVHIHLIPASAVCPLGTPAEVRTFQAQGI
jgi:hypothetical protein